MARDPSRNQSSNDTGVKPGRQPAIDGVRLATRGGVVVLLVISLWNWWLINRMQRGLDSRLSQIENRVALVSGKVDMAAGLNQPARRGPDPNRVYTINTVGAPVMGSASAPITIAEFSDFQ